MRCPDCAREGLRVVKSYAHPKDWIIRRRRYCQFCKKEHVSYEVLERDFKDLQKRRNVLNGLSELLRNGVPRGGEDEGDK